MNEAKYILIKTEAGFHYTLNENDDKILGTSEVYTRAATAENGIQSVRYNSQDGNRFRKMVSEDNRHYFNLHAVNGEIILTSKMFDTRKERNQYITASKRCGSTTTIIHKDLT